MRGGLPTPRTPVSLCSRALRAAQCVPSAAAHRQAQDSPARASSAPHMARIAENSDAINPLCTAVPAFAGRLAARLAARLAFPGVLRFTGSIRAIVRKRVTASRCQGGLAQWRAWAERDER